MSRHIEREIADLTVDVRVLEREIAALTVDVSTHRARSRGPHG
jgi:hypothetical protein